MDTKPSARALVWILAPVALVTGLILIGFLFPSPPRSNPWGPPSGCWCRGVIRFAMATYFITGFVSWFSLISLGYSKKTTLQPRAVWLFMALYNLFGVFYWGLWASHYASPRHGSTPVGGLLYLSPLVIVFPLLLWSFFLWRHSEKRTALRRTVKDPEEY